MAAASPRSVNALTPQVKAERVVSGYGALEQDCRIVSADRT
jgi:hypothetical protein